MLTSLSIKNLGLIQQADLDVPTRFVTITGETGAGKSMLLKALSLASGQRASDRLVGQHGNKAEVIACFSVEKNPHAEAWLEEQELSTEDHQCIIRRIIHKQGIGKQYINQTPVTLKSVKQLADLLLDMHFQQQHQSLLQPSHQQIFFDIYAGVEQEVKTLTKTFKTWQWLKNELQVRQENRDRQQYAYDLLQHQFAELDAWGLSEQGILILEQKHKELSFAQVLLEHSQKALMLLSGEGSNASAAVSVDALTQVRKATQLLEKIHDKADLGDLTELLASTQIHLEETIVNLQGKISRFQDDPEMLMRLDQQIEQLHQLARKHRVSVHELPQVHKRLQEQLAQCDDREADMQLLAQQIKDAEEQYHALAVKIAEVRYKQQQQLSKDILFYLRQIGLAETQFVVKIIPTSEPTPYGLESVSFWISTNAGQPMQPLAQVVSGGELSRISLALQMLKAKVSRVPVLVFDEVDVGIGGAVAAAVGKMLQSIGRQGQVLCITHQAQVAAYGDYHLLVSKKAEWGSSQSCFRWLDGTARIEELARMISGITVNAITLEHAANLLKNH